MSYRQGHRGKRLESQIGKFYKMRSYLLKKKNPQESSMTLWKVETGAIRESYPYRPWSRTHLYSGAM